MGNGQGESDKYKRGLKQDGDVLEVHYRHTLESLTKAKGMLGVISKKSQNIIQDTAKLRHPIIPIDDETWVGMDISALTVFAF
jgi:type I restriction enzyme M protein